MGDKTAVDDALRLLLEFGLSAALDEDRPDVIERNAPAVDFSASSNVGVLAIEHSLHEPYEGYSADMNTMASRLEIARRAIELVLPPDASITIGMRHATVNRLRAHHFPEFTEWGRTIVPTLQDPPHRHYEVWRHADGVEITRAGALRMAPRKPSAESSAAHMATPTAIPPTSVAIGCS